jgi:hypothetical protein
MSDSSMSIKTPDMRPRKKISSYPRVGLGAAGVFVLLCATYVFIQMRGSNSPSAGNAKAFFSVDDGKTWFADDMTKVPPYDKDGKQAIRAFVFRGSDGKDFVGYLQRFTPDAKRAIEQLQTPDPNRTGPPDVSGIRMAYTIGREVKRPGDAKWISGAQGLESAQIIAIKCSDGSDATMVEP